MTLAFGILSSTEHPGAVAQLADALGTRPLIVVHHDFSKQPSACRPRPNLRFVPRPARTSWGGWSLCDAILRLIEEALKDDRWRYFQLLSGSCLPVQPVAAFEQFVERQKADVNMDLVSLDADTDFLMSHGWRAYAPASSVRQRMLRRIRRWYLGGQPGQTDRSSLGLHVRIANGPLPIAARAALAATRLARDHAFGGRAHPFRAGVSCFTGSTWFGASRRSCEHLLAQAPDAALQRWFRSVHIPDEFYFQTVFGNADFEIGASNHLVSSFQDAHPQRLGLQDLGALAASGRFFARKFPDHPDSPVRRAVLEQIGALPVRTAQPVWRATAPPRQVTPRPALPRPVQAPSAPPTWWPTTAFRPR
jgi:hypothetical protein